MYDYIIAGAGITGSVVARELKRKGKKVIVFEKSDRIGGNCADEVRENIPVSLHGGHFFHTNNKIVWDYVNYFVPFVPYYHRILATNHESVYTYPINLHTLGQYWDTVYTPKEAEEKIERMVYRFNPADNFEKKALNLVGKEMYNEFIVHYTEKHWGVPATELPSSLINRVPVRYDYNTQCSLDLYQGMPENGYTDLIERILGTVEVVFNKSIDINDTFKGIKIIYTGSIDEYFEYVYGELPYRGVHHEESHEDIGCATMNFTGSDVPYTRKICYNYFYPDRKSNTIFTHTEFSDNIGKQYPIENDKNIELYSKYKILSTDKTIFTGRLGRYKYIDMDQAILMALKVVENLT